MHILCQHTFHLVIQVLMTFFFFFKETLGLLGITLLGIFVYMFLCEHMLPFLSEWEF